MRAVKYERRYLMELREVIAMAQKEIDGMGCPLFVPSPALLTALREAREAGIRLETAIEMADETDRLEASKEPTVEQPKEFRPVSRLNFFESTTPGGWVYASSSHRPPPCCKADVERLPGAYRRYKSEYRAVINRPFHREATFAREVEAQRWIEDSILEYGG
jgi:phosphatidylserine/phosphatidylglycerophosphate/cardiolipin synthase-like enzyme